MVSAGALWLVYDNDANADAQKRNQVQYQCFENDDVADVTVQANKLGADGWEMVTGAAAAGKSTIWCFKRPAWKIVKK